MINLDISNYLAPYANLNGQTQQNVKPFDLARGIVTQGRKSWADVFNLGIFRIGELICKALAFSKVENGNLVLHDRFFGLNQSEKATISYYFGQGLTKLYAEEFFKIKWLLHFDDNADLIDFHKKGTAVSKIIIGNSDKNAVRPDLIGLKQKDISFIFEAKGNSGGYDRSIMQHAINQVSQIKTYNGRIPETKTACYFDLSTIPIRGIIIDPEGDENGIDMKLDEEHSLIRYYSFFRENKQFFTNPIKLGDYNFLTTPVGVPNIFFGFDRRIIELTPSELLTKGLYDDNFDLLRLKNGDYRNASIGLDGIILLDRR